MNEDPDGAPVVPIRKTEQDGGAANDAMWVGESEADDPRGDFLDDYVRSARTIAVQEALRVTRDYPSIRDDVGAVMDVAEYILSGRRGVPVISCCVQHG